ncbi:MAG: hypothetical protein PHS18_04125 [Sphaerochaetaceae bacterium]|nr:hypothetical protein [Sphaerochaetaceae bacterium]
MRLKTLFFCFLLLAGLLAGDILTTVWFSSLGLAEANPLIAPIAGDALAQVLYKMPFVAVLLAGVVALSHGCERVRPGSGWGPWAVVLVMFAVPPIWNLGHIAAHLWM